MTFDEQLNLIEQMHQLIRLKATGTPEEFARKLNYSKRQVFRLLKAMKEKGFPIAYCKQRQTYFYEMDVLFRFEVSVIDENEKIATKGGQKFWDFDDFFFRVTRNGTGKAFLCGR